MYYRKFTNENISNTRQNFLADIKKSFTQLHQLSNKCIMENYLLMHDTKIMTEMAAFIKQVAIAYKEESEDKKVETTTITRSGRLIKKPDKLNL